MPIIETEVEIVLETPGVVRVATHPQNDKIQDSILTRQSWTQTDLDLLEKCFVNYYPQ